MAISHPRSFGSKSANLELEALPDHVTEEILSRLDPRDLMRFRAVSQSWRRIIDGQDFINLHLVRSSKSDSGRHFYIYHKSDRLSATRFGTDEGLIHSELTRVHHPIPPTQLLRAKLVGSVNGLICIHHLKNIVVIINPWIRQSFRIRQSPVKKMQKHIHYGFGYNSATNEYKLIRLINHENAQNNAPSCEAKVYSLRSNSWRRIPDLPCRVLTQNRLFINGAPAGVFAESALHWLTVDGSIIAINVASYEHRVLQQPELLGNTTESVLSELGGRLCLVHSVFDVRVLPANPVLASLWVMKEYGNVASWTRVIVNLPSVLGHATMRPIRYCGANDGEIVLQNGGVLQWYDLEQQIVVRTAAIPGPPLVLEGYHCVASLVRPSAG